MLVDFVAKPLIKYVYTSKNSDQTWHARCLTRIFTARTFDGKGFGVEEKHRHPV